MTRFLLTIPLLIALGGCAFFNPNERSILQGGSSITATIENPVTREQQAKVEVSYQIAARGILAYSRLPRCALGQTISLERQCSDWGVVQKFQRSNRLAFTAIKRMRAFADNNQKISATVAYNEVVAALRDIQNTAFINGIK